MSLHLKIIWVAVCILVGFGVYVIFAFPRNIQADSVAHFHVVPEEVRCEAGKHEYSPKWVHIVSRRLPQHSFRKEGTCAQIKSDLLSKNVDVYLYKPVTYMGRYAAVEVLVDQSQYLKLADFRRGYLGFIAVMFIVAPCVFAGALTYGPPRGRLSKSG